MSKSESNNSVFAAGIAAIVSGGLVWAVLSFLQPQTPANFETAIHDYLVSHPELLVEMNQELLARREADRQAQQQSAMDAIGVEALLDPMIAYVEGPENPTATVIEFFDYRCGFCKASLPAMKAVMAERHDVRFAFVEYPILTDDSVVAARAAIAARRQDDKYVPFHLALMDTQGDLPLERILSIAEEVGLDVEQLQADMDDQAITDSLEASRTLADNLQVNGTPTFVINGQIRAGAVDQDLLNSLIDGSAS
jgi:protein-disulfide isomerase